MMSPRGQSTIGRGQHRGDSGQGRQTLLGSQHRESYPALCADITHRASSHWADTVFFAASLSSEVGVTMTKSVDKRGKKHTRHLRTFHRRHGYRGGPLPPLPRDTIGRQLWHLPNGGAACCCGQAWVWTPQYISTHCTVYRHQPLPDTISQPLSWK